MFSLFKHYLRALLPPAIFLVITGYFAWNALHGARGLEAQSAEQADLAKTQAAFNIAEAQKNLWQTKIATLDGKSVAPDMLDSQARIVLNLATPSDIVVKLPPPPAAPATK